MSAKDIDPQLQKLDDELAGWKEPAQHLARGARIPRYAINLSSSTLDDRAFPKAVAAELIASGVPGTSLLFEISEDDAMSRLDFVKVDGVIVRKLLSAPAAEAKLKAILRVGEVMGFQTIGEMVEEQDILVRLKALGAGYAQGFGIQPPHPIEKLAS